MRVTPRREEVKRVVALLESDDFDSADALAKEIIKEVAACFAEREWYAFAWRDRGLSLAWGPLSSDSEVQRFAKKAALGGEGRSVKLFSTASMLDRLEAAGKKDRVTHCVTCEHPLGAHEHPTMRGCCAVRGCGCAEAKKPSG